MIPERVPPSYAMLDRLMILIIVLVLGSHIEGCMWLGYKDIIAIPKKMINDNIQNML